MRGWSLATIGAAPTWHPWVAHRTSRRLVPSVKRMTDDEYEAINARVLDSYNK